jgi:hypothetical protein
MKTEGSGNTYNLSIICSSAFLFIKIFPKRYDVYRFTRLFLIISNDRLFGQAELF